MSRNDGTHEFNETLARTTAPSTATSAAARSSRAMGVRAHARAPLPRARSRGPGLVATLAVVLLAFLLLVANGRTLPAPATSWASSVLLAAALAVASLVLEVDATGAALVGKAAAALFAALAAGALFGAVARRHGPAEGRWAD